MSAETSMIGRLLTWAVCCCVLGCEYNAPPVGQPTNAPSPPPAAPTAGVSGSMPSGQENPTPAAPTTAPPATPLAAKAITNLHPDLVEFSFRWSAGKPQLLADDATQPQRQEQDATIVAALAALDAAADARAQEAALLKMRYAKRYQTEHQAEVSQRLEALLASPDLRVKILATQLAATWATEDNFASLKKLAELDDPHFSNNAVWAIFWLHQDLQEMASYLQLPVSYHGARWVFMGEGGEEHIWPLLTSNNLETVNHALATLISMGTPNSVPHVTPLLNHADLPTKQQARQVLGEIQKRNK